MRNLYYLIPICFILGFTCCTSSNSTEQPLIVNKKPPSLKDAYKDHFTIGAALNVNQINGTDTSALATLEQEFNTITPENIMKWENIHPEIDRYDFDMADQFVKLGQKNKMFIVGHALVWHSQLGKWVETVTDSTILRQHLKDHISTIVTRYKRKVNGWDVVNEALNEDGTLRESMFLKVLGPNYIADVFEMAAAADPNVELYYNDYNLWKPEKRAGVVRLVKELQAKGIKIDGVGMQAHWSMIGPDIKDIEDSILAYSALGMKVMFTELDVTALPNPWDLEGAEVSQNFEGSPFMNPYPTGLPDSVQVQLADRYVDIFNLFLKHEDKISRVTFWGVDDQQSWLNNWPIKGRTNYPLLFDRQSKPKLAYDKVMELKQVSQKQ